MLGCCLALVETKDLCVNRLDLKCQIMLGLANVGLIWDVQIRFWLAWPSWDGGLAWFGLVRFANRWAQSCLSAKFGLNQERRRPKVD